VRAIPGVKDNGPIGENVIRHARGSLRRSKDKLMAARKKKQKAEPEKQDAKVTFYREWCKRCGICAAFCPTEAIELDEWDYPHLARPEKCTMCHLCEKLCPDFAIGVGETALKPVAGKKVPPPLIERPHVDVHSHSPERVAQPTSEEEEGHAKKQGPSAARE